MNPGMYMGFGLIAIAVLLFLMLWWDNRKPIERYNAVGHMGATIIIGLTAFGALLLGLAVCLVSLVVHVF